MTPVSGLNISNLVLMLLLRNNSQGAIFVVAWRVTLCLNKNCNTQVCIDLPSPLLAQHRPLEWLYQPFNHTFRSQVIWCWSDVLDAIKSANSRDVNWLPLSDTSCSGKPNDANTDRRSSMVLGQVIVDIGKMSGHLEWHLSITESWCPRRVLQNLYAPLPRAGWPCPRCCRRCWFIFLTSLA